MDIREINRKTMEAFRADGDRLLAMASHVGAPRHPDWYLNVVANPGVTVEVGTETYDAQALPTEGEERERLWATIKTAYPFFADHEAATEPVIPVGAISRDTPTS